MSADILLDRLQGVRKIGPDRWFAKCPAHEDRTASLSVREGDDGRTLVYCFALCRPDEVIAAVGLDWSAMFPVDWAGKKFKRAPGVPASDVLKALEHEMLVATLVLGDVLEKRTVTEADFQRLALARQRISAGREAANVRR